jgi:outer membrane protein insertion porin family
MAVCGKSGTRSEFFVFTAAVVMLLAAGFCAAQSSDSAAYDGMIIESVQVEGNVAIKKSTILTQVHHEAGQGFSSEVADRDLESIGQLEGVWLAYINTAVVGDRLRLTYVVVEMNLVRSITIAGNEAFSENKLLKELDYRMGDYLDERRVNGGAAAIKELYLKKGYPNITVDVDEEKYEIGQVVYRIDEGVRTTVKEVNFEGISSFTAGELSRAIKTKPKKYLFWPVHYSAEGIAEDKISLTEIYQKRGYLDMQVSSSVRVSDDRKWAYVTFKIDEGPVYVVDRIVMSGNTHFPDEVLQEELKLKVGDFYSQGRADFDRRRVLGRFLRDGFVEATVSVERAFIDRSKVRVEFIIIPGDRFKIGRVDISGNEEVHDRVIRRILDEKDFRPGEWFNGDLARGDGSGELEKLLQRNVYTQSAFIEATGQKPGWRNAQVKIEEGKTGSVMVGAGIASDQGLIGQFTYDQRNFDILNFPESWSEFFTGQAFKGAGQHFRLSINPGTVVSTFSVSFKEPYLYDKPISLETLISGYERARETYDEERIKGYVGFEKRYKDDWRRGFSFRLENVEVSDIDFDAPIEIKDVRGDNLLAGARIYVRKDTTDMRFTPSKGYHFNAGYEQVGGDYTFGVLDGTQRWYKTLHEDLAERKTILEMKVHGATIIGDAPPFEKFYAGGPGSLRGFKYRGVSTRGLQTGGVPNPQREDPIGSDWIVTANAEVAFPLASDVFAALLFIDGGMIDSGGPRVSVGTGIQILLPQWFGPVPMRFELATPVMKEDEDEERVFSFSVGALF